MDKYKHLGNKKKQANRLFDYYVYVWWLGTESNRRHKDFQSFALPTELPSHFMTNRYGGGRGIRTPAGFDTPVGFQDRSLQPDLGIPPEF